MIFLLCVLILTLLFAAAVLAINLNHRIAYALYKIPKVHYFVDFFCFRNKELLKESILYVPDSIMCAIDDMGWLKGGDLRKIGGPSRLISNRDPVISDYQGVKEIAEKSGTRLLGLFVLSEMDKENTCSKKEYNTPYCKSDMTELGTEWHNRENIAFAEEVMNFMYENSAYIEFGMHGVRHEYFKDGGYINAEWANGDTGESWGIENTEIHCNAFEEILRQYFPKEKCSFPVCFVPPSHAFAFYSDDSAILRKHGIKYSCSSCAFRPSMKSLRNSGQYSNGILFLDRTEHLGVNVEDNIPSYIPSNAWIGTHFPNYWGKSHNKWVKYLKGLNKNYSTMLGRNSVENYSQWIYNRFCAYQFTLGTIAINNLYMPEWAYENDYITGIWLKIHLHGGYHLSDVSVPGLKAAGYYEDEFDNGYVYLIDSDSTNGCLQKKIYKGTYKINKSVNLGTYIDLAGETFSVLNLADDNKRVDALLRIYGNHEVRINLSKTVSRITDTSLSDNSYSINDNIVTVHLRAENMIGELKQFYFVYE